MQRQAYLQPPTFQLEIVTQGFLVVVRFAFMAASAWESYSYEARRCRCHCQQRSKRKDDLQKLTISQGGHSGVQGGIT
jgi:hypothetical protein